MKTIDFDQRRQLINDELISVEHNIGVRRRELEVLKLRREQLLNRLAELDALESMRRHYGMIELIRLCRTPSLRFKPVDIDGILMVRDKSHEH